MAAARPLVLLSLFLFGFATACRQNAGASPEIDSHPALSSADEASIKAADSAFAASVNAGDAAKVAEVYAEDASLLAPNLPPQSGRRAIQEFWGGFLDAYTVRFEIGSDTIEGRGDLAYNRGHYRFTAVPKAKGVPGVADEGKFLEILKKQSDGTWKYAVDMYSSNLTLQH